MDYFEIFTADVRNNALPLQLFVAEQNYCSRASQWTDEKGTGLIFLQLSHRLVASVHYLAVPEIAYQCAYIGGTLPLTGYYL